MNVCDGWIGKTHLRNCKKMKVVKMQNFKQTKSTSLQEMISDDQDNEIDETASDVNTKNIEKDVSVDKERVVEVELTRKHSDTLEDGMVACLESDQLKVIDENGEKEKPGDEGSSTSKKELENDSAEEFYNCTSCGVTFTSVLEHIQTYHSNQEVVLEMNGSDGRTEDVADDETITLEFPSEISDRNNSQSDNIRRVITESGDIVTDYGDVEINEDEMLKNSPSHTLIEQEVVDEIGQVYTRKLVKIDKFWGNATIEEKSEIGDPVHVKEAVKPVQHQAVVKKVKLANGSWSSDMYNCVKCNAFASTLEEFNKHVCESEGFLRISRSNAVEAAYECASVFETPAQGYEKDAIGSDGAMVVKYPCPHCPVAYSNSKSLCAHMKVHKTGKQVALKTTLQSTNGIHKAGTNPPPNGPFRCEVCFTIFPTNKSLRLHRRMHDPIKSRPLEPPVEQVRCNMDPTETFHCLQCDKWIPVGYKKVHLNYHRSSHTTYNCGEKPHACEICGKSFRVSYCLTLHMRTHTGMRPYACPHCGKRFKAHSVYNHHLLTHSEVRAYKCPYCPKAFKTSVQLAGHKNSHTKPYSCTHCNRPFASLYAVRVHTDSHRRTNNLKFSCSLCGASYARTFALKDHMKQAHQSEIDADDNDTAEKEWADPSLEGIIANDMQTEKITLSDSRILISSSREGQVVRTSAESSNLSNIEHRAVIKYFVKKGKTPKEIFEDMASVLQESAPSYTMVKNGLAYFNKDERAVKMILAQGVL
ncbi:Zinc finger protein 358 [Eumeta japonica]|uniref:Zinc finger protein 358 n=1 Tax=Eumeta variegata TaxID=151549 RepID=A0A4C1Y2B0_EUMVA|nr:Zinc finger protein 358 [Eumeta japonica]